MNHAAYMALILEKAGTVAYICDMETYDMLYLTATGRDLYQLAPSEDYRNRKCYDLLQGLSAPCPFCTNCMIASGKDYPWEHFNSKLQRWMDVIDSRVIIDGRPCRLEIAHDITLHHEQLTKMADELQTRDTLFHCLETLSYESDLDKAMDRFLSLIGQFYKADRAYLFEIDRDLQLIRNTFEWCGEGVERAIDRLQSIPLSYIDDWMEKFETVGEFFISSLDEAVQPGTPEHRILSSQAIQQLIAVPFTQDGKVTGFLGVDNPSVNQRDTLLLRTTVTLIGEEMEKRQLNRWLEYLSYTDTLTRLKNRNEYMRTLDNFSNQQIDTLGVVYIDINGLKTINDTYGHKHGDQVILETADVIRRCIPKDAYRVGGDEFVVLCVNVSKADFDESVSLLKNEFAKDTACGVSIGYTWQAGDIALERTVEYADKMMYADKQLYYKNILGTGRSQRISVASPVLQEIEDGRFTVYLQPQVKLSTSQLVGSEALVRKLGEDGQLVPPDRFIPLYEREGVIRHVDFFVLETICQTIQKWGLSDLTFSVNFSRITLLESGVATHIRDICRRYQVSPQRILIEVTESVSKIGLNELKPLIQQIQQEGFKISLDDFGSKYANLSILTALDFHEVKIDKSLVDSLRSNAKSQALVRNVVRLCNDLGATRSLAEGIEDRPQLDLLLEYNCDYGQGYYFSMPLPMDEFQRQFLNCPGPWTSHQ